MFVLDFKRLSSKIQNSQKTLFILCGFPYAGKSYVVQQLRAQGDIALVSIDEIFRSQGFDWDANKLPNAEEWQRIFNESYETTKDALEQGKNVLYDSTNQTVASRDTLRAIAASVGADARVLYIKSPIETVWKRWEENQKNPNRSVVSRDLVQMTIDFFEEPTERENVIVINN